MDEGKERCFSQKQHCERITSWYFLLTLSLMFYNLLSSHLPFLSILLFHVMDGWHEEGSGFTVQQDHNESQMSHRTQEEDKHLTWHSTFAYHFWQTECRMTGWVLQVNPWARKRWTSALPEDDPPRALHFHYVELYVVLISQGLVPDCFLEGEGLNWILWILGELPQGFWPQDFIMRHKRETGA